MEIRSFVRHPVIFYAEYTIDLALRHTPEVVREPDTPDLSFPVPLPECVRIELEYFTGIPYGIEFPMILMKTYYKYI